MKLRFTQPSVFAGVGFGAGGHSNINFLRAVLSSALTLPQDPLAELAMAAAASMLLKWPKGKSTSWYFNETGRKKGIFHPFQPCQADRMTNGHSNE